MLPSPAFLAAMAGLASPVLADCTRAMLQDATASYLAALAAGKPTFAALGTGTIPYQENAKDMDITKGVLSQGIRIDYNRSLYDTAQCASYTEIVSTDTKHPYVIGSRLALGSDTGKVNRIDNHVVDDGDWIFNAAGTLATDKTEKWESIPAAQRDTRDVIKAAGDAMLDQWANVSHPVPLGTPCARLEGGLYPAASNLTANNCVMGAFPQPIKIGHRRYVIDEEVGGVGIFNDFPWLEKSIINGTTPSSNMMRVEGGKIRYIHELTVCVTRNCGR